MRGTSVLFPFYPRHLYLYTPDHPFTNTYSSNPLRNMVVVRRGEERDTAPTDMAALRIRNTAVPAGAQCTIALEKEDSEAVCVEGTTFGCVGGANQAMWTSGGCRGSFVVDGAKVVCSVIVENVVTENAYEVGAWGGSCTCPDGSVYQTGDNDDACGSLACVGGISGDCKRRGDKADGAFRRVVCGGTDMHAGRHYCGTRKVVGEILRNVSSCGGCSSGCECPPYNTTGAENDSESERLLQDVKNVTEGHLVILTAVEHASLHCE